MTRTRWLLPAVVVFHMACGSTVTATAGAGGSTGDASLADVVVNADTPWATDVPSPSVSCAVLTLTFVGCDTARRAECEREYAAVSPANRARVDRAVACLQGRFPSVASATWPAAGVTCSPAAVPALLHALQQWFHGGCQAANGDAAGGVMADPAYPACGAEEQPACFFGDPGTGATL